MVANSGPLKPESMPAIGYVLNGHKKKGTTKYTKEKLFFVLFVCFVVQGFSAFCDNLLKRR